MKDEVNEGTTEEDNRRLREAHFKEIIDENIQLKKRLNDLTILIHQVLEQDEADFFEDNLRTMDRQNIRRMLKAKFPLTSEQVDIVNKNKEAQQNMNNSNVI